jgi:hypothetical protein
VDSCQLFVFTENCRVKWNMAHFALTMPTSYF